MSDVIESAVTRQKVKHSESLGDLIDSEPPHVYLLIPVEVTSFWNSVLVE